jgi:hypothetical protein
VAVEKLFSGHFSNKFVRKLLNIRSLQTLNFTKITGLVPFSTATPGYNSYFRFALHPRTIARGLPTSRLPSTNPANFLETRLCFLHQFCFEPVSMACDLKNSKG